MAGTSTLPQSNITLRFAPQEPATTNGEESYQLLELPPEILKAVQEQPDHLPSVPLFCLHSAGTDDIADTRLTIKGRPSDDAVLCTPTTTFLLRTITHSNSLLVCRTPGPSGVNSHRENQLEIRGINHEVLECLPQAADVDRIRLLLRDSAWTGLEGLGGTSGNKRRKGDKSGRRWTRAQLESVVQASTKELDDGLKEQNVVEFEGESRALCMLGAMDQLTAGRMMLLPPKHLTPLLSLVLTLLTIHNTSIDLKASPPIAVSPAGSIVDTLREDHDVPEELTHGIMRLFGTVDGEEWTCDLRRTVAETGRGVITSLPSAGRPLDQVINEWKDQTGELWADLVDIALLEVCPHLSSIVAVWRFTDPRETTFFTIHHYRTS